MNKCKEHYREELIQVVAVGVAAIQVIDSGRSDLQGLGLIYQQIGEERLRQIEKFGVQEHGPFIWMTILGEEFGEACQAALRWELGGIGMSEQKNVDHSVAQAKACGTLEIEFAYVLKRIAELELTLRVKAAEAKMQCNCDLDNWEPDKSTGHSWVCRIHKAAQEQPCMTIQN